MEEHQAKAKKRPDSRSAGAEEHYCPICGREAADPNLRRFGEYFCSEAHVAEYAQEIRARVGNAHGQAVQQDGTEPIAAKEGQLSRLVKLGACCAAPILALVILVPLLGGSAGGLAAIGGNLFYFAALLACPLAMYFMMRNMHQTPQQEKEGGPEESGDPKALPRDREKL